jgi:hypothetical protein
MMRRERLGASKDAGKRPHYLLPDAMQLRRTVVPDATCVNKKDGGASFPCSSLKAVR